MTATYALPHIGSRAYGGHYGEEHLRPQEQLNLRKAPSSSSEASRSAVEDEHNLKKTPDSEPPLASNLYPQHTSSRPTNLFSHADEHQHRFSNTHYRWYPEANTRMPTTVRLKRGLSDLGRPATTTLDKHVGYGLGSSPTSISEVPSPSSTRLSTWLPFSEFLTSLLIPLPFILASIAYPSPTSQLRLPVRDKNEAVVPRQHRIENFINACALTSGTLLLVGILARWCLPEHSRGREKYNAGIHRLTGSVSLGKTSIIDLIRRILGVLLPFYAAMNVGGIRTGLALLAAATAGITCSEDKVLDYTSWETWKWLFSARRWTCAAFVLTATLDVYSHLTQVPDVDRAALLVGYVTLGLSLLVFQLPIPFTAAATYSSQSASSFKTSAVPAVPLRSVTGFSPGRYWWKFSPLISSAHEQLFTFVAGAALACFTVVFSVATKTSPPLSYTSITLSSLSMASAVGLLLFTRSASLNNSKRVGFIVACTAMAGLSGYASPGNSMTAMLHGVPAGVTCVAVLFDIMPVKSLRKDPIVYQDSQHHAHHSTLTNYLLQLTRKSSILYGILAQQDSRRIFYFMCLNLSFMTIQAFYGFVTGSLGLLSDSIHMLFDCLALIIGLSAAVMSKWPADIHFPYGYGKIETLSGFANGVLLILISIEIVIEAAERLFEGQSLKRINELLAVSILGFLVNIVGLYTMGHEHHGHGHSHGHSHNHNHTNGHVTGHSHHDSHTKANGHTEERHTHTHDHPHGPTHGTPFSPIALVKSLLTSLSHGHGHEHRHHNHGNDNMVGLYLHILGDALGSLSVIVSTILTKYHPSPVYDPLASCLIAVFIAATALPLVWSSARNLLLSLPGDDEYRARNALQEISGISGVVGYTVPRFWLENDGQSDSHAHGVANQEKHSHGHAHSHSDHTESCMGSGEKKILGVMHVIASRTANLEDVRQRTVRFLEGKNMDIVVHVEREGEGRCWCGGGVAPR